jgi:hypothetical protein
MTCAFSSQNFVHSPLIFLMFTTVVVFVLSLPLHTSRDNPSMLLIFKSSICDWKPLMTSSIVCSCSSVVASTTRGTFGIALYKFWIISWVFCVMLLASSLSLNTLLDFSSCSLCFFTIILRVSSFPLLKASFPLIAT